MRMMKKDINLVFILIFACCYFVNASAQENCRLLEKSEPNYPIEQSFSALTKAGKYCLERDVSQRSELWLGHGSILAFSKHRGAFFYIASPNITIDLQDHLVASYVEERSLISNDYDVEIKNVELKNGRVVLDKAIGIKLDGGDCVRTLPRKICETKFLLENLDLYTKASSIQMKGAGSRIKSSRIHSEVLEIERYRSEAGIPPMASVRLTGPNNVIENSIIIYDGYAHDAQSAPIRLIDADNTIIRNNIIVIRGMSDKKPKQAIAIVNSKNVVLENNRVFGADALFKLFDSQSAASDKDNTMQSNWQQPSFGSAVRSASEVKR
jgi:Right handed beta helix region